MMRTRTTGNRDVAAPSPSADDWQWKARRVLARFGARTVPALVEALASGEDPAIRRFAAESLGQLGPDALNAAESLRHAAQHDGDPGVRATASAALAAVEGREPA